MSFCDHYAKKVAQLKGNTCVDISTMSSEGKSRHETEWNAYKSSALCLGNLKRRRMDLLQTFPVSESDIAKRDWNEISGNIAQQLCSSTAPQVSWLTLVRPLSSTLSSINNSPSVVPFTVLSRTQRLDTLINRIPFCLLMRVVSI
ncbi:hypothetical protein TNCV_765961 [Trichonephila clavipes]|nr:hypothetical protein TNCV_765961 [Trichonephila clavipes]